MFTFLALVAIGYCLYQGNKRLKTLEDKYQATPPEKPAAERVREGLEDHVRQYHKR